MAIYSHVVMHLKSLKIISYISTCYTDARLSKFIRQWPLVDDKGRSLGGMNCMPKGGWKVTVKQIILKRSGVAFNEIYMKEFILYTNLIL